jgi:hypothetical protein
VLQKCLCDTIDGADDGLGLQILLVCFVNTIDMRNLSLARVLFCGGVFDVDCFYL